MRIKEYDEFRSDKSSIIAGFLQCSTLLQPATIEHMEKPNGLRITITVIFNERQTEALVAAELLPTETSKMSTLIRTPPSGPSDRVRERN